MGKADKVGKEWREDGESDRGKGGGGRQAGTEEGKKETYQGVLNLIILKCILSRRATII